MSFDTMDAAQTATYLIGTLSLLLSFALMDAAMETWRRFFFAAMVVMALVSIAAFSIGSGISGGRSKEALCQNQ